MSLTCLLVQGLAVVACLLHSVNSLQLLSDLKDRMWDKKVCAPVHTCACGVSLSVHDQSNSSCSWIACKVPPPPGAHCLYVVVGCVMCVTSYVYSHCSGLCVRWQQSACQSCLRSVPASELWHSVQFHFSAYTVCFTQRIFLYYTLYCTYVYSYVCYAFV